MHPRSLGSPGRCGGCLYRHIVSPTGPPWCTTCKSGAAAGCGTCHTSRSMRHKSWQIARTSNSTRMSPHREAQHAERLRTAQATLHFEHFIATHLAGTQHMHGEGLIWHLSLRQRCVPCTVCLEQPYTCAPHHLDHKARPEKQNGVQYRLSCPSSSSNALFSRCGIKSPACLRAAGLALLLFGGCNQHPSCARRSLDTGFCLTGKMVVLHAASDQRVIPPSWQS